VLGLAGLGQLLGGCGTGSRTGALPSVRVRVGGPEGGDSMSVGVQLLLLLTVLSLVPAILMTVTSFIRIAIVLSFARTAIGMPQMPPNQIVVGLATFLTVFVMAPVWTSVDDAMNKGSGPLRELVLKQTRERATLREPLLTSPIGDGRQYTRAVEDAYRDLWQRWCATRGTRDE